MRIRRSCSAIGPCAARLPSVAERDPMTAAARMALRPAAGAVRRAADLPPLADGNLDNAEAHSAALICISRFWTQLGNPGTFPRWHPEGCA
jgi:hypothetical protein